MKVIPVSIYFMPEWWDRCYHSRRPRPKRPSQKALEDMYLRRQRFLFENFSEFGIGNQRPTLAGGQIATVMRWGFDLVPALLGTELRLRDAWGFYPVFRDLHDLEDLRPVDIEGHPEGERLRREKERLASLYGPCFQNVDIGSACNNAFRMVGEELYSALLDDREALRALFDVIIETEASVYRLLRELFPPMDPVPISNCNVCLMSPAVYEEMLLEYDGRQNRFAEADCGAPPRAALHHCDAPADDFLPAYRKLPGVASLQASLDSDIRAAKEALPGCSFSAMIGPRWMCEPADELRARLRQALEEGADDFALWNVDAGVEPQQVREILSAVRAACRDSACEARFCALPLCWEEIEWAHAAYEA